MHNTREYLLHLLATVIKLVYKVITLVVPYVPVIITLAVYTSLFLYTARTSKDAYLFHPFVFGDFLVTIPLTHSFVNNLFRLPEYPLFSGVHLSYHWGFFWITALIIKLIIKDSVISLNLLSIFSLLLLLAVYSMLARLLFPKHKTVAILSPLVFIFNPSQLFTIATGEAIATSINVLGKGLLTADTFYQFNPYKQDPVSVFWNLNTLVNQRHFILGLAIFFGLTYTILKAVSYKSLTKPLMITIFVGNIAILLVHRPLFLVWAILLGLTVFFAYISYIWGRTKHYVYTKRLLLLTIAILIMNIFLLEIVYKQFSASSFVISKETGFLSSTLPAQAIPKLLARNPLLYKAATPLFYTLYNFGVLPILALLGLYVYIKRHKRILPAIIIFLTAWAAFTIAFTFRFGPDIAVNHKFINLWIYVMALFAIYLTLVLLHGRRFLGVLLTIYLCTWLLTNLIIDILPYLGKQPVYFPKTNIHPISKWVGTTPHKDTRFLNLTYDTTPITITGRSVFLGWDYYPMSMGYNTQHRRQQIYNALDALPDLEILCKLMLKHHLSYIYLKDNVASFIDRQISPELLRDTSIPYVLYLEGDAIIYHIGDICMPPNMCYVHQYCPLLPTN